jgi:GDPmannose 4,6-dehydratase
MEGHKSALIIGINGQLGYYLKELLLSKGYRVHGLIRVSSTTKKCAHSTSEVRGLPGHSTVQVLYLVLNDEQLTLMCTQSDEGVVYHYGDLADINALVSVIASVRPRELYNVGSMSNAQV